MLNPFKRWGKGKAADKAAPPTPPPAVRRPVKSDLDEQAFALIRASIRKASKGRTEFLSDLSGAERRTLRRILERKARRAAGKYPVGATWSSMSQRKLAK